MSSRWPILAALAAVVLLGVTALAAGALRGGGDGTSRNPAELQALAIERQLLCPQCTNKRLDVCELAICRDMQRLIRERLDAGDSPDEILALFRSRYGQRVLADIPVEGFNLVLFGWVGGSILLVAAVGGGALWRMAHPRAGAAVPAAADDPGAGDGTAPADDADAWLESQLQEPPR